MLTNGVMAAEYPRTDVTEAHRRSEITNLAKGKDGKDYYKRDILIFFNT